MFRELVALGIFDGKLDYRVKINRPEMIFDFKIEVRPVSRTLAITHLGPFAQSSGPIAMLGPGGLDASPNYSERLIDEVLEDVKQQLITANPERRQPSTTAGPQVDPMEGVNGNGGDWMSAGVTSGQLADPLDRLVRRGVFRCKLPDILIGSVVVRVDKEDPQDPVLKIGFWTINKDRPDICWILTYRMQGRVLDALPGKMPVPAYTALMTQTLIKYNEILDGFVIVADLGLLE